MHLDAYNTAYIMCVDLSAYLFCAGVHYLDSFESIFIHRDDGVSPRVCEHVYVCARSATFQMNTQSYSVVTRWLVSLHTYKSVYFNMISTTPPHTHICILYNNDDVMCASISR